MRKPIQLGLFQPAENDMIIVRGSFNNWAGNEYFLDDLVENGIYENTFFIDSDSGIVHEYKYVIIKSDGRELWEKSPNQDNKPYGNRILHVTKDSIDVFDFDKYHLGVIGDDVIFSVEEIKNDFIQFRNTLEENHCCLYEYTGKQEFDSLFNAQYRLLIRPMAPNEFYKILTPVTAKIGCGHTAVWMPGGYWDGGRDRLFPIKIRFIEDYVLADGSYEDSTLIPKGSILQEINNVPIQDIIEEMRRNYSADALNIHFIDSQIERRFPLIYARRFGFKDTYKIKFVPPGSKDSKILKMDPVSVESVRMVVFSNFSHPPLTMDIIDKSTAVLKISTFGYYDRVQWFTHFIDSCFTVIRNEGIKNLILDLRGNDGGDPFCAAPLFSYLQKESEPYFSEPYGKYSELAKPLPLPENHFTGELYTIIDGQCFSTNGHFCSLLKYHKIGRFVGAESGATYKCNAGRNTEVHLNNTQIILNFGRSTFAAAVEGLDKSKPIMPDYYVKQTMSDFLADKDTVMDFIFGMIEI